MRTVIGQGSRFGVRKAVGCVRPRQRMRIDRIFRTGFVVVEIQALQHVKVLLYLVIGDDGFAFLLRFRTKTLLTMINDRISAYIEPVGSGIVTFVFRTHIGRCNTSCAQTVYHRFGILSGRHTRLCGHTQEVICFSYRIIARIVCLGFGIIGVPSAIGIPSCAPNHGILAGCITRPCIPVIITHVIAEEGFRVFSLLDIFIAIALLGLQQETIF